MLLWLVKWRPGYQDAVELSSDVAFQAADDLGLGLAFLGASLDVGVGRPVPGHSPDRDQIQRQVRLPVAAPVQTSHVLVSQAAMLLRWPQARCSL